MNALSMICEEPLTKFVIVEDSVRLCGEQVFLSLLNNHSSKNFINMVCLEKHPTYYESKLSNVDNISYLDCFTNVLSDLDPAIETLMKIESKSVIVIDSLSEFILLIDDGFSVLRKWLQNNLVLQIIVLLHIDCLPSSNILMKLEYLATAILTLNAKTSLGNQICSLLLRRHGRKVIKQNLEYWFDENNKLKSKIQVVSKNTDNKPGVQENIPADLSTFRIELSEVEKKSRDAVVLPYTTINSEENTAGGGKIIYELEAADDWDEEDPDDDLDI